MNEENKTELIDRYLDEELSFEEKDSFEKLMIQNNDLKLEVEAQDAVRNFIKQLGEKNSLAKMLDGFHEDLPNQSTFEETKKEPIIEDKKKEVVHKKRSKTLKIIWGNWSYMAVAASVAITFVGIWMVIKSKPETINQAEVRLDDNKESLRIPLLTWRQKDDKPVLQNREFIDVVIDKKSSFKSHYKFTSVLELYLDPFPKTVPKISVHYDQDTGIYELYLNSKVYKIQKTDQILPLN